MDLEEGNTQIGGHDNLNIFGQISLTTTMYIWGEKFKSL
jgi:hypothetical protein